LPDRKFGDSRNGLFLKSSRRMKEGIHYDIIGDVHGRFDKLTKLMDHMGYQANGCGFTPPLGRMALFLGDLIDPKPGHEFPGGVRATLHAVKAMVDAGDALCLMGNHELNALYFHTRGPDGEPLRKRSDKNVRMHEGTLSDFPDHADPAGEWLSWWLPWMRTLPLYFDLGGIRAVHATWHDDLITRLDGLDLNNPGFFLAAADKRTAEGGILEILLKGVEISLPTGVGFTDHAGVHRTEIRVRWWELPDREIRYDQLVFPENDEIPAVKVDEGVFQQFPGYANDAPPVFFGHFFKPPHLPLAPERHNVACLDYSASKDGPLVAYRWKGEDRILPDHYVRS